MFGGIKYKYKCLKVRCDVEVMFVPLFNVSVLRRTREVKLLENSHP